MRLFPELFTRHRVAPVENYPDALLATLRSVAPRSAAPRPDRGPAHAGALQLGLLRALVPGRQARHRARRGVRSLRQGRSRLHAHDGGSAARRRDLSPHRRRLPRSARLPAGFGPRRAGPHRAPIRPATSRSPTRSAPASPTTRPSTATCRRSCASSPARSRSSRTCRPGAAGRRRRSPTSSITCPSSSSRRSTAPAATACSSARTRRSARSMTSPASSGTRPDGFIAQPTLALSTCPTFVASGVAPRHVDLRPFVLTGADDDPDRARRPHPRRPQGGLARRQFEPGRRHQGHVGAGWREASGTALVARGAVPAPPLRGLGERPDACSPAPPTTSTGCPATRSGPTSWPASSTPRMRLASLPSSYGGERNEWESAVAVAGDLDEFKQHLRRRRTRTRSATSSPSARNNPSSIRNCIETARENARAVRTALTRRDVGGDQRRLARAASASTRPT